MDGNRTPKKLSIDNKISVVVLVKYTVKKPISQII